MVSRIDDTLRADLSLLLAKLGDVELQSLLLLALLAALRRARSGSKETDIRDPLVARLICETPLTRSMKIRQLVNSINEAFSGSVYAHLDTCIEVIMFIIGFTHSRYKK